MKTKPGVGGIMLWDVSWDQNNVIDGKIYSGHVFDLLKDTEIVRTPTEAPTQGGTQGTVSISTEGDYQFHMTNSNFDRKKKLKNEAKNKKKNY